MSERALVWIPYFKLNGWSRKHLEMLKAEAFHYESWRYTQWPVVWTQTGIKNMMVGRKKYNTLLCLFQREKNIFFCFQDECFSFSERDEERKILEIETPHFLCWVVRCQDHRVYKSRGNKAAITESYWFFIVIHYPAAPITGRLISGQKTLIHYPAKFGRL